MSMLLAFLATLGDGGTIDVTPNAVNWANISGVGPLANANQTVNGCNTSITISAAISGATGQALLLEYRIDSGSYVYYGVPFSINAAAGQTLNWRAGVALGSGAGTVTVTNDSDGGATLDTFTCSVST